MNAQNLFDYCSNEIITIHKTIYFIGDIIGNSLFTIAIDNTDHKIYSYSNEWLYLINYYYYHLTHPSYMYTKSVEYCNNIIQQKCIDFSYADYDVIPFITSFSKGTTHGYSGLFYILNEYINEDWSKRSVDKTPVDMTKEEFAISQARSVRILRNGEFNTVNKDISLWNLPITEVLETKNGEIL